MSNTQGRFQMSVDQLAEELSYRSYRYNRLNSPNTPPEAWTPVYGANRVHVMEQRLQLEKEAR